MAQIERLHVSAPLHEILQTKTGTVLTKQLAAAETYLTKLHNPEQKETTFTAIIDKQLSPTDVETLLAHTAPIKTEPDQLMKDLKNKKRYEAIYDASQPQPVPPGFAFVEINAHRKQLQTVLSAPRTIPEEILKKPLGVIYPLEEAKKNLFEQAPRNYGLVRRLLIDTAPDQIYLKVLKACDVKAVFDEERHPVRQYSRKTVIDKLFATQKRYGPRRIDTILHTFSSEELDQLAENYARLQNYGFVIAEETHEPLVIIGNDKTPHKPETVTLDITLGNTQVQAHLEKQNLQGSSAYSIEPTSAKLKEYLVPVLKWKTTEKAEYKKRSWDLDFIQALEVLHPEILRSQPDVLQDLERLNPLFGLITLIALNPEFSSPWGKSIRARNLPIQPITAGLMPIQAAAHQMDLLSHPLLQRVEQMTTS